MEGRSLYKYVATENDIDFAVKETLCNRTIRTEDDEKLFYECKKDFKNFITDFVNKFDIYYTDIPEDFKYSRHRKEALDDYNRHYYEITLVNKSTNKNRFRDKFITIIGMPMMNFDGRYHLDLAYIFSALSFDTCNSWDYETNSEEQAKRMDETSNKLYEYLSTLEYRDSFWLDILNGSL